MKKFRVLLVATNVGEALNLQSGLCQAEQFDVVGTSQTGADCVEMAIAKEADLLVLNLKLRDMDGLEVIRQLKQSNPNRPKILALSQFAWMAKAALSAGADHFLCLPCGQNVAAHLADLMSES